IWYTLHSIVDDEREPSNTEFFVDVGNIIDGHNDSMDVTISGPTTHELTLGVGDGIYIANLMLAPNSCDGTAVYWLAFETNDMGCLVIIDCRTWLITTFSELFGSTSAMGVHWSVWEQDYLMGNPHEMSLLPLPWYDDSIAILFVA
ncbi:hypothetical protein SUGI_0364740, partial [Cryptomeria japonica]